LETEQADAHKGTLPSSILRKKKKKSAVGEGETGAGVQGGTGYQDQRGPIRSWGKKTLAKKSYRMRGKEKHLTREKNRASVEGVLPQQKKRKLGRKGVVHFLLQGRGEEEFGGHKEK